MAVLVVVLGVCVGLLWLAPAAFGAKSLNGFVGGQAGVHSAGFFTQPRDVAVFTGGDLDPGNDKIFTVEAVMSPNGTKRVQRLDGDGNAELVWGGDVVVAGAPGDLGVGFEVCDLSVATAEQCKAGVAGGAAGMFDDPTGVAVDQVTGRVFVLDRDNHRVQEFDLDGGFIRTWGWGVATGTPVFEICTTNCQQGIAGSGAGQLGLTGVEGVGIAVSPVDGDVFVADPANQRILRFNSNGTVDGTIGSAAQFAEGHPQRVAVDANGVVYASDSAGSNQVVRYDTTVPGFLDPLPSPALLAAGSTRGLEVDPNTGNLLVARQVGGSTSPFVVEVADPGGEIAPAGPPTATVVDTHVFDTENPANSTNVQGLGFNPTDGNIYLATVGLWPPPNGIFSGCEQLLFGVSTFHCAGLIVLAVGGPVAAGVDAPLEIGSGSATVAGTVDAGGGVAQYVFEVSADGSVWEGASDPRYLSGTGPTAVSGEVAGLEPNSFYRLRLRVFKQVGMDEIDQAVSGEQVFLTDAVAPAVQTLGSTARTDSSVRLRGRIDPQGAATSWRFEWGPAGGSFDHRIPVPDGSAGSGNTPEVFTADLTGLLPDTAYHYRVVATNFVGTAVGDAVVFRTRTAEPDLPPGGRAFELVSPADKVGGQGLSTWYAGVGMHGSAGYATPGGERFVSTGSLGSVLMDGAYSYATDASFDERTGDGWTHRPVVTRAAHGRQAVRFLSIRAANPDLSLTTWASNGGTLRFFEEYREFEETENNPVIYLRDWEGAWEPFGPTDPSQSMTSQDGLGATVLFEDGSGLVGSSPLRGLAGVGDPALTAVPEVTNVYLDDLAGGLSDTFPGDGVRSVLNVCAAGTVIPARDGGTGKLGERPCPPAGERQTVSVTATGGSFTLTFEGQQTTPIAFDATPGAVQSALEGLSNLNAGDVVVWGGPPDLPGWPQPYVVLFAPTLADVDELTANSGGLSGTGASVEVETVAQVGALIDRRGGSIGRVYDRALASAVSEDLSRVFFMAPDPQPNDTQVQSNLPCAGAGDLTQCPPQLYVAQLDENKQLQSTRWIARSEVPDQDAALLATVSFEGASRDGDKALLRTTAPLTADDPNGGAQVGGGVTAGAAQNVSSDLFLYDFPDSPGADLADGELTRVSGGPTGTADANVTSAGVPGASGGVRFMSEDGSRVYFATAAPIPGVGLPDDGTITDPGGTRTSTDAVNLYLYDANLTGAQRWRFVARLPRSSALGKCATESSLNGPALTGDSAGRVNPGDGNCWDGRSDGSFVTFWTDGRLTGDDPDSVSGDVYGYDAVRDELVRLSAPQGGVGGAYPCMPPTDTTPCYGDPGFGIGSGPLPALGVATDPAVAGDRLAFFQSAARLVPEDTDGGYDVYQWRNGVLSLVTVGDSETDGAFFQGSDRSGNSVFFSTLDRLTWQDHDAVMDVYVARVGGGIPEPALPPGCDALAGACQGPGAGAPQLNDAPLTGGGNATPGAGPSLAVSVSAGARRRAARRGVVAVSVRSATGGRVRVVARARVGGRSRRVGRGSRKLAGPGRVVVGVRLARTVRRLLGKGRSVRVVLVARQPDGSSARTAVVLSRRRAGR